MISNLQKTLDRIRAQRAAQAKIVAEIEAPLKRLREIEAEEQALAAQLAEKEACAAQLEAELYDCRRWLERWEPYEARLIGAREALEALEDNLDFSTAPVTQFDFNKSRGGVNWMVECFPLRRAERDRLQKMLKELGAK